MSHPVTSPPKSPVTPTLHMICGKIASGKSTLTAQLGQGAQTVVIAEDDWLNALFGDQMTTMADYLRAMDRLRGIMGPHVVQLLRAGLSVVLDFQANTVEARSWMRDLLDQTGADHVLHLLDVPDAVCLARLQARNARGTHPFLVTDAQFHQITRHFTAPSAEEGFTIRRHA